MEKKILLEALNEFAQRYIMLQEAEKAHTTVSDDNIFQNIQRDKRFQTEDGKFNIYGYSQLPNSLKAKIETEVGNQIKQQLFEFNLMNAIKTSDLDLRIYYQEKFTKSKIRFVIVKMNKPEKSDEANLLQVDTERTKAEKIIDNFLAIAKKTGDFAAAANACGLSIYNTDFFGFFEPIKKPDSDTRYSDIEFQDIFVNAFRLNPMQISDKISLNNAFVVFQVLAKQKPDMDKFYKERPKLKNEYTIINLNNSMNREIGLCLFSSIK